MLIRSCLVALGFVSAMAIVSPGPTLAQGVYIDMGRPRYHERHYRGDRTYERRHYRGDRDVDRSYAYDRGRFGGCRTITIERDDGSVRRVRRCD